MPDGIRPIARKQSKKASPQRRKNILSHLVRVTASLTVLIGLGLSGWYFSGFAENDGGFKHLASAAILSFGLGGLLYAPAFLIALRAHAVLRSRKRPGLLPLILILPWFPVIWRVFVLGGFWTSAALCLLAFALLVLLWVIIANRNPKRSGRA